MSRVVVLGSSGQIAKSLSLILSECQFISRSECDLGYPDQILATLDRLNPQIVINAAAFTQVDLAENARECVFAINAIAPRYIAEWSRRSGASLIHYSTDYVFSGGGELHWKETDTPQPINIYGASKLAGEEAILEAGCHAYIFRTSWVHSPFGKNFLKTMISRKDSCERIQVIGDQWGAPTSALDLARATSSVISHSHFLKKSGVFNMTNSGVTSWHGFAEEIFRQMRDLQVPLNVRQVESVSSADYPTKARRPKNSRLDGSRLRAEFSISLRDWKEALNESLRMLIP